MARRRGIDEKLQVTKGFVTEFTPVAFPQEAATDIDNCIIDIDGSVRRRPGIDLEQGFVLSNINGSVVTATELQTLAFSTHLWRTVNNSGTLNIVVQQIGRILQFYTQAGAVSSSLLGELDLTTHAVNATSLASEKLQVSSGLGNLYVVSKSLKPLRINFDGTNFTVTEITISIRDFTGVDDGTNLTSRPGILEAPHHYNLLNQGWTDTRITEFFTSQGRYPSNVDIMSIGVITNSEGNLEFDADFVVNTELGNTPAPSGHFILDAFVRDYNAAANLPQPEDFTIKPGGDGEEDFEVLNTDILDIPSNTINTRPEAIVFHQGRVFYSMPVEAGELAGIVYSQQLTTPDREGNCFQEADPTTAEINDLVETDGGFLPMPGVGQIFALKELGNGIVVITSNGVWFIAGAEVGSSISATNLRLEKVSSSGALSATSVVEAEDAVFYFGKDGVMQVQLGANGSAIVVNLSQKTIQSFYINISAESRGSATATYIPEQRKLFWSYTDALASESPVGVGHDTFLILDFEIQGFYKYSIAKTGVFVQPEIVGLSRVESLAKGASTEDVLELDGSAVTELDGTTPLTIVVAVDSAQITELKVAVMVFDVATNGYKVSFATFRSRAFTDWRAVDNIGIPMTSFVEFAEFNMGAIHTKGRPSQVHSFFSRVSKNLEVGGYHELPQLS